MRVYSVSSTKGRKCRKDKKKEREGERERDLMFRVLFSLFHTLNKTHVREGLFFCLSFSLSPPLLLLFLVYEDFTF